MGSKTLPYQHAPERSQNHRVSKYVVEQLGHWKVSSVKNHAPYPSVETNERKSMPKNEERRIGPHFASKLHQASVVNEEIEGGEEDGSWFLKKKESHERPLSVELRNVPSTIKESLCRLVHASKNNCCIDDHSQVLLATSPYSYLHSSLQFQVMTFSNALIWKFLFLHISMRWSDMLSSIPFLYSRISTK